MAGGNPARISEQQEMGWGEGRHQVVQGLVGHGENCVWSSQGNDLALAAGGEQTAEGPGRSQETGGDCTRPGSGWRYRQYARGGELEGGPGRNRWCLGCGV